MDNLRLNYMFPDSIKEELLWKANQEYINRWFYLTNGTCHTTKSDNVSVDPVHEIIFPVHHKDLLTDDTKTFLVN